MRTSMCWLVAAVIGLAAMPLTARQTSPAATVFQEALLLERAEGNLTAAVMRYERVVTEHPSERLIVARALLQLGSAYEKLGRPNARGPYERIVREYDDQPAVAAEARSRLTVAQAGRPGALTSRKVWDGAGADNFGSVSPDGRYLSYMDPVTGDLAVHDVVTGTDRRLTSHPADTGELAEYSVFSPDGNRLAYGWRNKDDRYELRTVARDGGAARLLYSNGGWLQPKGWSPDGRRILTVIVREDRTRQLVFVSAADGSMQALRTLEWNMGVPSHAEFSPDGRFVAYDRRAEAGGPTDVFVIAVDGTREEVPVVTGPSNDRFLGWFPDSGSMLVSSNRTGSAGAWVVSIRDGQPMDDLRLLKPDIGQIDSKGLTRAGDFLYFLSVGVPDILTASVDPASGRVTQAPTPLPHLPPTGRAMPAWSPDGRRIAYRIQRTMQVGILDLATSTVQTTPMKLSYGEAVNWAPDGRSLLVVGTDLEARSGVFRIDPATGAAESLGVTAKGLVGGVALTPDGERLVYRRFVEQPSGPPGTVVVVRHLKTGQEQEIARERTREISGFALSPDGQWLALRVTNTDDTRSLEVIPASGGRARTILRDKMSEVTWGGGAFSWSADGRYVLLVRGGALWRVPVTGDAPEKIDLAPSGMNGVRVHPDGRRLALIAFDIKGEVWAMENLAGIARSGQ